MKNTILFCGALFVAMFTVSCKKDHTCQCEKTYTTGTGSSTKNYSVYTYKDTRTRAESRCNENASSGTDLGGDYAINCAIE